MKRIFVLFLAFVVLMTAAAIAEEPVFQLDNGLRWGMNQDEIFALLGEEDALAEPMFEGVDTIQYVLDNDIPDDDCEVTLSMVLVDSELALIMYDLLRVDDPAVRESCISGLTTHFGEPIEGGMDRFMSSFGLMAGLPELTAADIGAPGSGVSWELSDGTYMGVYDLSDISFGVYFVNEPRFAAVADHYAVIPTVDFNVSDEGDLVSSSGEVIIPASEPVQVPGFDEFIAIAPTLWGMKMDEVIKAAELSNFEFRELEDSDINSIRCESMDENDNSLAEYIFSGDTLILQQYSYITTEETSNYDPLSALTALYGEPVVTEPERLLDILNACGLVPFPSVDTMLSYGISGDITWYPADGSFIMLSVIGDNFTMHHISSDIMSVVNPDTDAAYTPPKMAVDFSLTVPGILHSSFDDVHSSVKGLGYDVFTTKHAEYGPDIITVYPNYVSSKVVMNYMFDTRGLLVVTYGMTSPGYVGDLFTDIGAEFEAVYGLASTPDDHTHYIMNMVTSGNYESAAQDDILSWMLEDGTAVMLVPVTEIENSAAVIYIAKDMLEQ